MCDPLRHRYCLRSKNGYSERHILEKLVREYAFLGDDGIAHARKASVAIIGDVESESGRRSCLRGLTRIATTDSFFDHVAFSSLNRHATAGLVHVGAPRVYSVLCARAIRVS